jgi:multidrug efflux pump subunit AcrB
MDVRFGNACLAFAAGTIGAVANSLAVWLSGKLGISAALSVAIAPALTPTWLYPRLVWGGLWGLLLLLPMRTRGDFPRGLLISLPPTLAQLLVFFPRSGRGFLGLDLGTLTPVLVFLFNAVWGWAAVAAARRAGLH